MKQACTATPKTTPMVLLGVALYILIVGGACVARVAGFDYGDFDLAIHAQSTRNILHGSLNSSILGVPFLGNHMVLILFLAAPLAAVFPPALLLVALQTMALAAGGWFVYLLARRVLPASWAAGLAGVYLAYPPLISMNLYEFHPIAFTVLFVLVMLYGYRAKRFGVFVSGLGLALLCQENVGLMAVAFGVYAWLDRQRGCWVWVPLAAGVAMFVLTVVVVMPRLNPNIQFVRLYGHLGGSLGEVFVNMVKHPVYMVQTMLAPAKLTFLAALLGPVGFISLLSPLSLAPGGLVLVQRLLSGRAAEATIAYHYQAEFVPWVFYAAIYGVKRMREWGRARIAVILLAVFALVALAANRVPQRLVSAWATPWRERVLVQRYRAALALVPADAAVLATFRFLPALADRAHVYSLHHVYTGRYTLSTVPYPMPAVDFILVDREDPLTFSARGFYSEENEARLAAFLAGWEKVFEAGAVEVYSSP